MVKTCKTCNKEFKIISQEKKFYNKVNLALPELCPNCRQKQRLSFKNPRQLNKKTCSKCGQEIITTYPVDFEPQIYCSKCFEESFN